MSNRITTVNAYTTLDLVAARIETHETVRELDGVVDVGIGDDAPDRVRLSVELDTVGVDAVTPHADRVELTPEQAETLADDLRRYAEDARAEDG
ncbi:hypothetical protein EXE43_14160 [Halorubrum sp. SS5]|nr:hypothetical protein EXE43_14160 [Halorubrum sp. SS5]